MDRALSCGKPVVIDAMIDVEEMPPVGSRLKALDKFFKEESPSVLAQAETHALD
jgi:hypothetical protein